MEGKRVKRIPRMWFTVHVSLSSRLKPESLSKRSEPRRVYYGMTGTWEGVKEKLRCFSGCGSPSVALNLKQFWDIEQK